MGAGARSDAVGQEGRRAVETGQPEQLARQRESGEAAATTVTAAGKQGTVETLEYPQGLLEQINLLSAEQLH